MGYRPTTPVLRLPLDFLRFLPLRRLAEVLGRGEESLADAELGMTDCRASGGLVTGTARSVLLLTITVSARSEVAMSENVH